jgi:hypothetical protein
MKKLKGNFSLDKDRFELLKKADGEYKTTLFAGYYKKYSIVIDEEHCILENKELNNKELKNKEKINIKRISLTHKENDKFHKFVELTEEEILELVNKYDIINFRIFKTSGHIFNKMKLLYIEELVKGVEYPKKNEIYRKEEYFN